MLNLENRLIEKNFLINNINDIFIDNYDYVNKMLNKKIEASISFLMNTLNELEQDLNNTNNIN